MSGPLEYSIDMSSLTAGLSMLADKADKGKMATAMSIGYEIVRLSSFEVPHDKGSLQNSATVQQIGDDVVVGYHEPYAARLHEHPEYRFQKGRKGKYLIDPIIHNASILGVRFGKGFEEELTS